MTLRDEFEGLWPIPSNVIFDEPSQEYRYRDYPNTTSPVNDMWESFCDGARVQQKRVEELEEALRGLLHLAGEDLRLDDIDICQEMQDALNALSATAQEVGE
jgi:hypothetical protein